MMKTFFARMALLALPVLMLGALFAWPLIGSAAAPGSAADPLVTEDWVIDYVDSRLAPLQQRLEQIEQKLGATIVLTIGSSQATVNGRAVQVPAPPQIMGAGYTMVPARFIGEALGLTVDWDSASRKVTFSGQGRNVTLTIDKTTANINGQAFAMPFAPVIANGHTLVHARFVGEAFQCKVDWSAVNRRVTITR